MFEHESDYAKGEGQVIYTNAAAENRFAREQQRLLQAAEKKREAEFESGKKKRIVMGIKCYWCDHILEKGDEAYISNDEEDVYYQCQQHKTIFCKRCAWNFYKQEIERREAPKCRQNPLRPHVDCIYEKKEIT